MIELHEGVAALLRDPEAIKVLGTADENGVPHVVRKGSLTLLDDGNVAYGEALDSSQTNKNMVRSIWFDKTVSITVIKGDVSYQIKGRPYKCVITGPLFHEFLLRARRRKGPDADVQSVWIITPDEVRVQTSAVRREEEATRRPYFNRHLDRDAAL